MEIMHIPAMYIGKVELASEVINQLPKRVGLVATVQFVNQVNSICRQLQQNQKKCFVSKGKQKYHGQILGCDVSAATAIKDKVDAFLYIGTGEFHPANVLHETGKPTFCYNPESNTFYEVKVDQEKAEKRKKGAYMKYLASDSIGILVSTKPGQERLKEALRLKKNLQKKGKKAFILISNTLDFSQLENFNFIGCFVNTMCPRIASDDAFHLTKSIINYDAIPEQDF
jgi:2-(3-amino-3-carboxypropyl)histidine synthase